MGGRMIVAMQDREGRMDLDHNSNRKERNLKAYEKAVEMFFLYRTEKFYIGFDRAIYRKSANFLQSLLRGALILYAFVLHQPPSPSRKSYINR